MVTDLETSALDKSKLERLNNVQAELKKIYSSGEVCNITGHGCLQMEPGLTALMANSRNYDELVAGWKGWRKATGKQMKDLYAEFVELRNEGAKISGRYNDTADSWISSYESDTFEKDLIELLVQLQPLYNELHTYVRFKLQEVYKDHKFPATGHIPAHLLGNMWSQTWDNILEIVQPFKNKTSVDVTSALKEQNYTVHRMFKTAEDFFVSLGLKPMPETFWNNSMFERPPDRKVVCHASAWDFLNGKDFRIKMCTSVNMDDLITIHHEMGHIQYYLQYTDKPLLFKGGANPGFHEAVGDVMALSVATPKHLHKIGLLDKVEDDNENVINFLMSQALSKIAFLPFGYLMDQWRWSVFRGETPKDKYNTKWWELRCKFQGISPPVERTEEDFDPGAKYHIPGNTPYIRYFVSYVIQFQFHKALCKAAGHSGPLHECDIYNSTAAGKLLGDMLKMGKSKPWPEAMKAITKQSKMDVSAILEYFAPLIEWLKEQNKGQRSGWTDSCPNPVSGKLTDEESAWSYVNEYNTMVQDVNSKQGEIDWSYATNITDYNQEVSVNYSVTVANFEKEAYRNASMYEWKNFKNETLKRLFKKITDIGTSALEDKEKLHDLSNVVANMETIYSKANVCLSDGNCHQIEPGLTRLLTSSGNTSEHYHLLAEAWQKWRDNTGKKMKADYQKMVQISNEAINVLGYNNTGDYWRSGYETSTFRQDLENLLQELSPLYENLHAYVRRKLKQRYGSQYFPQSGHIPAHLFGNMWAQQWNNIYDILIPFEGKAGIDVTPVLKQQNKTALDLFKIAEEFFVSLGLKKMPETFWNKSMITKPLDGREVVCHASAWDFYNQKDFRIKMCTDINMEDLITIHHEMGHIQYYLQYKDLPVPFRRGANSGFHEAVGDVLALSVSTPKHLNKIGLLDKLDSDLEADLNFLMSMALDKIAFLPFGYLIDQWRWSVFSGETTPDEYNQKWWDLRCKFQGISPPVKRSKDDFDPGAKYHIPANVPYIRYFVSFVIQFQFHEALCNAAGHRGPLYQCDIYQSKEAGQLLGDMLRLGSSKPWQEAMEQITGQRAMSAKSLMKYFEPLTKWLTEQNAGGEDIGWGEECPDPVSVETDINKANKWLAEYNTKAQTEYNKATIADWNYAANITDVNQQKQLEAKDVFAQFQQEMAKGASEFDWKTFPADMERQFSKISDIGTSALSDKSKLREMNKAQSDIEGIYGKGTVCMSEGKCLSLEPDLLELIATSRNYTELLTAWKGWRDNTGKKMKTQYARFVQLSNEGVQELGYEDTGDYWRSWYESPTFQGDLKDLLEQLRPLYEQLHGYVRGKLMEQYGAEHFSESGHIPAHLLGNMWAQEWNNIYDIVMPYKGKVSVDITPQLRAQNYTVERMFRTAEEFFKSLNLTAMPDLFWKNSVLKKPKDREIVCHASAWDFYDQKDFRIKMCTDITMEHLVTIHHEMGHIQYYLQYRDQPVVYRDGANPGFHEGIGDVMALSVATPKHLKTIGLLDKEEKDHEAEINFLLKVSLEKIAFLPFGYLIDQWRWSVFSGETTPDKYNQKWWDLKCQYQGIAPPIVRSEEDFDPGAKYHIPANTPYIRYFVSFVVQFQFHKALCDAAGYTGPLHKCDIYRSHAAGKKLGDMLKMGSSKPWSEAMEVLTGQSKMNASALIDYFKPLTDWLKTENSNKGYKVGWDTACPVSSVPNQMTLELNQAKKWLTEYNTAAEHALYVQTEAEWAYTSNITDENQVKQIAARLVLAKFNKEAAHNASMFKWQTFNDESVKRQFESIADIGTDGLSDENKLKQLNSLQSDIEGIYGKGQVCLTEQNCLPLEPDLYEMMAKSKDYDELLKIWKGWRDATGRKMKDKYAQFVELSNEGIKELGFYNDTGEFWRSWYESSTFQQDLQHLLDQLKPLYEQLHTYVRRKLQDKYGRDKFPASGHIPAHLLGNMWAQEWQNLYDIMIPYKGKSNVDVTSQMRSQNYTALRMFQTAEEFFTSLGLQSMPKEFWDKSIIEKPADREIVCHASAWDFYNRKDFRIKMCTAVNMEDLITIHHEMGHIQYFLQYKDKPVTFRDGANPGFHEAVGDVLALSVATPKHLQKIKLLDTVENDKESDINFLMKMALEKIAFLPFGYLMDQWRWSVFSGETTPDDYNQKWWDLRCKYQGIAPPVERTAEDFDPGAKYHIPGNTPYIRYFISFVVQFQFQKALCETAGHTGPLHTCDIYRSKEAGDKLGAMLRLGSSKPWPEAMMAITGQPNMDAKPIIDYFIPLIDWLKEQNKGDNPGWSETCSVTQLPPSIGKVEEWLTQYEKQATVAYDKAYKAEWAYTSNITSKTKAAYTRSQVELAHFEKQMYNEASQYDWQSFYNTTQKRLFKAITNIGTSALSDMNQLEQLKGLLSDMSGIYGNGKVCLSDDVCHKLEPDLYEILAESTDYDKLLAVWKGWRDVCRVMKPKYVEYVYLSNKAIRELGYNDYGDYWRSHYDVPTFEEDLENLLKQLQPLYQNLHTYVRSKLMTVYGEDKFPESGHIPAHLLGNMWGQHWNNIYHLLVPFKNKEDIDVTQAMRDQGYTPRKMFEVAEEFFTSLGLEKMPSTFWNDTIMVNPPGVQMVCHASAWDFYNRKDFRIKMCTTVTMENLFVIHHEMGHVQYFLQYKNQPVKFREGANSGFHEAIGDVMALSVSTPEHLHKINLLEKVENDEEADINFLMQRALDKVAFLPFGYLIDKWRWSVFSRETIPARMNDKWWQLRCRYQGISPPVKRTDDDFDPGSKYHIPANVAYIRYFISYVVQFQFHKALCDAAGHTGPLHRCDIYRSKEAGKLLSDMLKLGSSVSWPEAMEKLTGQRKMDVGPILEYFQPLQDWLEKQNYNQRPGWSQACPVDDQIAKKAHLVSCDNYANSLQNNSNLYVLCIFLIYVYVYRYV
ncbi:uncharacterized protein LOC127730371 [Mytilus californianus]|uniref:uncharacterized protein LOC127730371 n=1 Tax=Mytilus californianus TaxID=6549 RepID=UPI002247C4C8|nr:uncharacterized protein LOC127730371 [Mytilus californianus]